MSLNAGIFPDDWKIARVTPIHKFDNKTDCGIYRPISIISNIAQIFEKAVYSQLITFLNEKVKAKLVFTQTIQQKLPYHIQ